MIIIKKLIEIDPQPGVFAADRFSLPNANSDINTTQMQYLFSEASSYAETEGTGATIELPQASYLLNEGLSLLQDGVNIMAKGPGGDTGTASTMLVATPDMADDSYMLTFDTPEGTDRPVSGPRVEGFRLGKLEALTNTIHGIYFRGYRGIVRDVHIQELTGHGIVIEGYPSPWDAYQNHFILLDIDRCDGDGIHVVSNFIDTNFYACNIHGNANGYYGASTGNKFWGCHFWGNTVNVHIRGGVQPQFVCCQFREPKEHNVILDATTGAIVGAIIVGSVFRPSDALLANDTYDNLLIKRDSGGNTVSGVIGPNAFHSAGTNDVRYHINLSGAVSQDIDIWPGVFDANAVSGAINNPATTVRVSIAGLSRNAGDPASTGHWLNRGFQGRRVWNTVGSTFHTFAEGAWQAG